MSTHDTTGETFVTTPEIEEELAELAPGATADESDDVEGHNIGAMNPTTARLLAEARERDIARQASRSSLLSEAKRKLGRKG